MVKKSRISLRDYVTHAGKEWVVIGKSSKRFTLMRRQVRKGQRITVPKARVKLADQSWRDNLKPNDPIEYFFVKQWVPARVMKNESGMLTIQPSFTNHIVQEKAHSSRIAKRNHNFPMWTPEVTRTVLYNGLPRVVRGDGLLYPWEYGSGIPIPVARCDYVKTVEFDIFETNSYPVSMYPTLDSEQIIYDLYDNLTDSIPYILRLLVSQYALIRGSRFQVYNGMTIEDYIDAALEADDNRRVNELLTVGPEVNVFNQAEAMISELYSRPVLDLTIRYENKKVIANIQCTGYSTVHPMLSEIYEKLSTPMNYAPVKYEVLDSPEMSYILSRMLGMEDEYAQQLHLRRFGVKYATLHGGICPAFKKTYGGVLNVYGLNVQELVRRLMKLRPLKTLVITHSNNVSSWNIATYHGSRKEDDLVVVTSQHTFARNHELFNKFDRLICVALPSMRHTAYMRALKENTTSTRWAVCPDNTQAMAFRSWRVHSMNAVDDRGCIRLTKQKQLDMGVTFPIIHTRKVECEGCDIQNIRRNTRWFSKEKREKLISQYMLHTSLVPIYLGGERLDEYEGTIDMIADRVKLDVHVLKDRISDVCAVCMEKKESPTVTTCGHVYCSTCTRELYNRGINCPLCRSNIQGFMHVSTKNTPGQIVMHNGSCYRVQKQQGWGSKIDVLRKYPNATIISKYTKVLSKLKKELPNKDMFTLSAALGGRKPKNTVVLFVEPFSKAETIFDCAYGKCYDIITLWYPCRL